VGSPHLLMLSGIGLHRELEAADVVCRRELPDVGKHLKDHIHCALFFPAPGIGLPMAEIGVSDVRPMVSLLLAIAAAGEIGLSRRQRLVATESTG